MKPQHRRLIAGAFAPALLLFLAGCAAISARKQDAPFWSVVVARPMDSVASCVVKALNQKFIDGPITHAIQITDPGVTFEIVPQQTITLTTEIYFVRLRAIDKTNTELQIFSAIDAWGNQIKPPVQACSRA